MPHMGGKEAAEGIRAVCPSAAVVYMSGYTEGVLYTHSVLEASVNLI